MNIDLFYDLGIIEEDIKNMLEQCPDILDMSKEEINEKIAILTYIGCQKRHIKNIISSNPPYLERSTDDVLKLITYLKTINMNSLHLLFDTNPYFLNKDDFEIKEYVRDRLKEGKTLEDIVEEIEDNPYIIDEI